MGRADRHHSRLETEGIIPSDACDQRTRDHPGQTGPQEHVRVSCVQDENSRTHLRVDVQFEDQRQTSQVDPGWRSLVTSNLTLLFMYSLEDSCFNKDVD